VDVFVGPAGLRSRNERKKARSKSQLQKVLRGAVIRHAPGEPSKIEMRPIVWDMELDEPVTIFDLMGGNEVLEQAVDSDLDWHEMIKVGLPTGSLHFMTEKVGLLSDERNFKIAFGMSSRTSQRKKAGAVERLSPQQSGRAWKFAEVLAKATDVFGSQDKAEAWMTQPAMALDRKTPLELLDTAAGQEMVDDLLTRLDYGVYT
jgi:putative toxin-antitoxin system antitoxin component (TIGR02293 family)